MAALTLFRQAVQTQLQTALGIEFVPGRVDGPVQRQDLGCVWPVGVVEREENVGEQILTVQARVFKKYVENARDSSKPYDPVELEQLQDDATEALDDIQTTAAGVWFFRVTEREILYDDRGVELTILGWSANDFSASA